METNLNKVYSKLPNKKNSNGQRVVLGLLNNFAFEYDTLEEEVGRLSYAVDDFFEEKYGELEDAYGVLKDVYIRGSESLVSKADVQGDMATLEEILQKAIDLGLDINEVYPDYDEHKQTLKYLFDLELRFDEQKRLVEDFGLNS
tara:strand:+ start:78 stop:509 length:432 start_codon:yes stop_codon:yes gene_type:complete